MKMCSGEWRLYTVFNSNRVYAVQAAAAIARIEEEGAHRVKRKYRRSEYCVQEAGKVADLIKKRF